MRYPYEVRKEADYFDDIPDEKITKDMLDLAKHIVETKKAHFEPERFEDQYEEALKELLKKKQSGQKIEAPREREPSKVVNLMDALRRSVETERGGERRKPARGRGQRSRAQEGGTLERAGEEGGLAAVSSTAVTMRYKGRLQKSSRPGQRSVPKFSSRHQAKEWRQALLSI